MIIAEVPRTSGVKMGGEKPLCESEVKQQKMGDTVVCLHTALNDILDLVCKIDVNLFGGEFCGDNLRRPVDCLATGVNDSLEIAKDIHSRLYRISEKTGRLTCDA